MFMEDGVVVEEGSAEEVLSNPKEEATKRFLRRILRKEEE